MYYTGSRHKDKMKAARMKRRITLYESPNIIECRDINDVLQGFGCRRRYFFDKRGAPPLLPIAEDYALEFQQDWLVHMYLHKDRKAVLSRPQGITFHHQLPYMGIMPDWTQKCGGALWVNGVREVAWSPVIVEVMTEPRFRVFEHDGLSEKQNNILQFCLAVKKRSERAILLGGCIDPLEIKVVSVVREPDRILEIERAVEAMYRNISARVEPVRTTGECEFCRYFRRCVEVKRSGDKRPDLNPLIEEWMRARLREWEASEGVRAIEDQIRHKLQKVEKAYCDAGSVSYGTVIKWRVDTERLLAEQPDTVRKYRINTPKRALEIRR